MAASIKNRGYNCRISFGADGEPIIGWVKGFYSATSDAVDIKAVPDSTIIQIAKALGITKSSRCLTVHRALEKQAKSAAYAQDCGQQELFEIA